MIAPTERDLRIAVILLADQLARCELDELNRAISALESLGVQCPESQRTAYRLASDELAHQVAVQRRPLPARIVEPPADRLIAADRALSRVLGEVPA